MLGRTLVVAPAFNEVGKISRVVKGVLEQRGVLPDMDLLVVDDASTDETSAEAKAEGALTVRHEHNQGVGAGIRTGINYAREHGYAIVAVISGDDQHDPTDLERVIGPVLAGELDLVQGSRYIPGGRIENPRPFRRFTIPVVSLGVTLLFQKRLTDVTNGLRAFRVKAIDELGIDLSPEYLNGYELEPFLLMQLIRRGARWSEAPVTVRYHQNESFTKMKPFRDWWRLMRPFLAVRLGIWT